MEVRRVVAGPGADGKTVFLSDGVVPHSHDFASLPGQSQTRVWFTPGPPSVTPPAAEPTSETGPVIPGPGGASLLIVRFAPDSVAAAPDLDPGRSNPGFAEVGPDIAAAAALHPRDAPVAPRGGDPAVSQKGRPGGAGLPQVREFLALGGAKPVGPDELPLPFHQPLHVPRYGAAPPADVDHLPAPPHSV